jgi:GT2 family glycosyltransferase
VAKSRWAIVLLAGVMRSTSLSVIVPFHKNVSQLKPCLSAVRESTPNAEIIVAADGTTEDLTALAAACAATVVSVPGPSGPAVARNRAAAIATGDILVFVDSDVVVASDAIPRMSALLEREPDVAGVFGAYDRQPAASNFMSQFKNLSHTYVHEVGNPDASTFWAGLGAVRASAFRCVGGFDERFGRPSVEDIDLGYRLVAAGYTLRLDPRFRGCHLKRWTIRSCVATDVRARGVPWMQLIRRFAALKNDLNTSVALRVSVVAAYLLVASFVATLFAPWSLALVVAFAAVLVALNLDYYRWMAARRGWWFAVRVFPVHLLHHLCNGVSFAVGSVLFVAGRYGVVFPWTLPGGAWPVRTTAPSLPSGS